MKRALSFAVVREAVSALAWKRRARLLQSVQVHVCSILKEEADSLVTSTHTCRM